MWEEANENQLETEFPQEAEESPPLPMECATVDTHESALLTWILLFLVRLQARHYIPDSALNCLLKFLYIFLRIIGRQSNFVAKLTTHFPKSIYQMKKRLGIKEDFIRFVVCKKCYSVYNFKDCFESHGTQLLSKVCTHKKHSSSRSTCGALLLKSVKLNSGKVLLYPFKVYCYKSLKSSLQDFLLRSEFSELCEHWRSLNESCSEVRDIYDGKLWKDFHYVNGEPLLASPYVYAVIINIDWFQPFKLTQASIGAIYLTVLNLPFQTRFKRQNVILLGIIPGPSEPARDINQYLRPFVDELSELFTGVPMQVHKIGIKTVRCILLGVACDMPAGRKAAGFLSHSAHLGCTKCYKVFAGGIGLKVYSGFDREMWKIRTNSEHRAHIREIQNAPTLTARNSLESKYGCRYSVLLDLPYFDPTRMLAIDPMHNLFLGTSKHIIKDVWMSHDNPLLSPSHLHTIQDRIDNICSPSDIGRIPHKIETRFSGCTADQFKNWVLLYSMPYMYSLLDQDQLECWQHFVLACRLLCKRSLSHLDINLADALLLQFCRRVQRIYGSNVVTPNMHMHCHLKSVILEFGPVYAFWLFSFEHFNGILGNQPTNNQSIEIQLMKQFQHDSIAYALCPPEEFSDEFADFCSLNQRLTGSLLLTTLNQDSEDIDAFELSTSCTCHALSGDDVQKLELLLCKILSLPLEHISLNSAFRKYKYFTFRNIRYECSTNKKSSISFAKWHEELYGPPTTSLDMSGSRMVNPEDNSLRPVKIHYLMKISFLINTSESIHTMCFVVVSWFQPHPYRFEIGKPAQVWCYQLFEPHGPQSFLPVANLCSRCVHSIIKVHNEDVLVVVPLVE